VKGKVIISAVNVHTGGGLCLLNSVLELNCAELRLVCFVDERAKGLINYHSNHEIQYIKPTILARAKAELDLLRRVTRDDMVLAFGNLPPVFPLRGKVFLLIQNRFLVDNLTCLRHLSVRATLRNIAERLWIRSFMRNVDICIVQSTSMSKLLEDLFSSSRLDVRVFPFIGPFQHERTFQRKALAVKSWAGSPSNFLYVASGDPHKNHRNLISAWRQLADWGLYPSLCLTIDRKAHPKLTTWIDLQSKCYNLNIRNLGLVTRIEVLSLYEKSSALIYPSLIESIGLPLIEARMAGLPILASELDFVRDSVQPAETFDPTSGISIARAVVRFMKVPMNLQEMSTAGEFLKVLLK